MDSGTISLVMFFGVWVVFLVIASTTKWKNAGAIGLGGGFVAALFSVWLFNQTISGKNDVTTKGEHKIKPVVTEVDPTKRGVMAMDAIYASEGAFMQHGMSGIEDNVRVLQHALVMWPETGDGNGIDTCRMALRIQTTYMLNVMDRLSAPADSRLSQFRKECRSAVNYVHDDARVHQVWNTLSAR